MSQRQPSGQTRTGSRKGDSAPPPSAEVARDAPELDEFHGDQSIDSPDEVSDMRSRKSSF